MPFFAPQPTLELVEARIANAQSIIKNANAKDTSLFDGLLINRMEEFRKELQNDQNYPAEKANILRQYHRFAKTLQQCLEHPQTAASAIRSYLNYEYYPVYIVDIEKPNPTAQKIMRGTLGTGIGLLIGSIPAFCFNPIIGVILISLAVTCLLPSTLYLISPDSKDTSIKKDEEKILFQESAKLIDPKLTFEIESDCNAVNSLKVNNLELSLS